MVRKNVVASTAASPHPERSNTAIDGLSIIFQATTASTDSGMKEASGAATNMNSSRKITWSLPATGPWAPVRTLWELVSMGVCVRPTNDRR